MITASFAMIGLLVGILNYEMDVDGNNYFDFNGDIPAFNINAMHHPRFTNARG